MTRENTLVRKPSLQIYKNFLNIQNDLYYKCILYYPVLTIRKFYHK